MKKLLIIVTFLTLVGCGSQQAQEESGNKLPSNFTVLSHDEITNRDIAVIKDINTSCRYLFISDNWSADSGSTVIDLKNEDGELYCGK